MREGAAHNPNIAQLADSLRSAMDRKRSSMIVGRKQKIPTLSRPGGFLASGLAGISIPAGAPIRISAVLCFPASGS